MPQLSPWLPHTHPGDRRTLLLLPVSPSVTDLRQPSPVAQSPAESSHGGSSPSLHVKLGGKLKQRELQTSAAGVSQGAPLRYDAAGWVPPVPVGAPREAEPGVHSPQ